jgi:hypothetical protein
LKKYEILNGNALKIIALVSMIIDHVGVMLFPYDLWLRCLGRISLPIFAYMVAEGCRHTSSMKKYFLRIFILGVLCQAVYFVVYKTLYLSTLISFSLAIAAIALLKLFRTERNTKKLIFYGVLSLLFVLLMLFLLYPPSFMERFELCLDYGIYPFLIPVVLYFIPKKEWRILAMIPLLYLLSLDFEWDQLLAFAALPILMLYNGRRGKVNLKYLFYVAYPLHLVLIFGIYMFFF